MEEAIQAEDQTQAQYFFFTMESSMKLEPAKNALNTFEKEDITMWKSVNDSRLCQEKYGLRIFCYQ